MDEGLFKKFLYWLGKGFVEATGERQEAEDLTAESSVEKDAHTFGEKINRVMLEEVTREMHEFTYALADSLCSIICDNSLTSESKKTLMAQSLEEFNTTVRGAMDSWTKGKKITDDNDSTEEAGIQKSDAEAEELEKILKNNGIKESEAETATADGEKEETDTMKIDKSKMTAEEQAVLADFEKRYGMADEPDTGNTPDEPIIKDAGAESETGESTELHPEVAKALDEFREISKQRDAEVAELKKNLEIEKLKTVAKKYEVLGKNSDDLATKLYDLKKAGGTVYDDYVALLDENVETVTKSGLFGEIGSNQQGSMGTAQSLQTKAAEIGKSAGGMSSAEAIVKAFEDNPELAAQYDAEYKGNR